MQEYIKLKYLLKQNNHNEVTFQEIEKFNTKTNCIKK